MQYVTESFVQQKFAKEFGAYNHSHDQGQDTVAKKPLRMQKTDKMSLVVLKKLSEPHIYRDLGSMGIPAPKLPAKWALGSACIAVVPIPLLYSRH